MSKIVSESNDVRVNRFGTSKVYFIRYKKAQQKHTCKSDEELGRVVREMIASRSTLDRISFMGGIANGKSSRKAPA